MFKKTMSVCYFGYYKKNYSRNRNIIKALRRQDIEVIECQSSRPFLKFRYLSLLYQYLMSGVRAQAIIVGFPGHTDVFLAFLLSKVFHKKLIFDPFMSLFNTVVDDRKYAKADSLVAHYYFWLDKISCQIADTILIDTNSHIKYFVKTFRLPERKFFKIPISADETIFYPQTKKTKKNSVFVIGFHGNYLPLQGVEYIIEAAAMLKNQKIEFRLLGNGIGRAKSEKQASSLNLKNVKFIDSVPYEELPQFIAESDIYLGGPFENNLKSQMVVPNKVVEAMSLGKPVVVGRTKAMQDDFKDKFDCYMVGLNSGIEIANALLNLKSNPSLRKRIANNALDTYKKKFNSDIIGRSLLSIVSQN